MTGNITRDGSAFGRRIADAERALHTASRRLARLKDPRKKCALMWELAWGSKLRDLEDFRPAGGFSPNATGQPRAENQ